MVPILVDKDVLEPSYNDLKFMIWNHNYFLHQPNITHCDSHVLLIFIQNINYLDLVFSFIISIICINEWIF